MVLFDFAESERVRGHGYHGNAGQKRAYLHDGAVWMVKFPQNTRNFEGKHLPSYTSSPISEYIGSHIYDVLGIPVHETVLGRCCGKIVVGCKDFAVGAELLDFHGIKNTVGEEIISGSFGSSAQGERLQDVLRVIENAEDFEGRRDEVTARFWDMFVVDAFIHNDDRNNGNWGLLVSRYATQLAPVFDNGNAFFNKRDISVTKRRLGDAAKIKEDAREGVSFFTDDEDKHIRPYRFIESMQNPDCTAALLRFAKRCDMKAVRAVIEEIPETAFGLEVIAPETKQYYVRMLEAVVEDCWNPVLQKMGEALIPV